MHDVLTFWWSSKGDFSGFFPFLFPKRRIICAFPEFLVLTVTSDLYNFLLLSNENPCLLLIKSSWYFLWCLECISYWHITCLLSQSSLPHEDTIIFVVSTTGQGDTPDSMKVGMELLWLLLFLFWERPKPLYLRQPSPFPFLLISLHFYVGLLEVSSAKKFK